MTDQLIIDVLEIGYDVTFCSGLWIESDQNLIEVPSASPFFQEIVIFYIFLFVMMAILR